jgi:hypothetical protein
MRNIYVDEAGTTAPEPVTIVVGVVTNLDTDWFPVLRKMRLLWDSHVPARHRKDFHFHAKAVSDGNRWSGWSEDSRRRLMRAVMELPGEFRMPVAFAAVKRGAFDWSGWPKEHRKKMTAAKSDHMIAFSACIGEADNLIRTEYGTEVAQVIVDDNVEMRAILSHAMNLMLGRPLRVPAFTNGPGGTSATRDAEYRRERVVDEAHFLPHKNAPFLQIADACAFGLRRHFAGQSHGDEYLHSITGAQQMLLPPAWHMLSGCITHELILELPPCRKAGETTL